MKSLSSHAIKLTAWYLVFIGHIDTVLLSDPSPEHCGICVPGAGNYQPHSSTVFSVNDTVCTTLSFKVVSDITSSEDSSTSGLGSQDFKATSPSCTACTDEGDKLFPRSVVNEVGKFLCMNVTFVEKRITVINH